MMISLPGFNAEASLDERKKDYALTLGKTTEDGKVRPQLFCRSDAGGTTCYQCWDEGGYSGCYSFRVPHPVMI